MKRVGGVPCRSRVTSSDSARLRPGDEPLLASLRNNLATQAWPKALPPDYTGEMVLPPLPRPRLLVR